MSELIKSIIFGTMGLIALIFGIITSAGTEVIVLGAIIFATAVCCILYDLVKKNNKKNE